MNLVLRAVNKIHLIAAWDGHRASCGTGATKLVALYPHR
jgi:hypothetical protein